MERRVNIRVLQIVLLALYKEKSKSKPCTVKRIKSGKEAIFSPGKTGESSPHIALPASFLSKE